MRCPKDGTALQPVEILGLELDKCHQCDGMWFDRGELERIRDAKVPDIEEAIEEKYGDPAFEQGDVAGHMRCPRCGDDVRLVRRSYTYTQPVKVDYCTACFGFWLDDGELNAIAGEKASLEKIKDPGPLKGFLQAMAKLIGRGQA
jgi:Zn-finger nucleic acid-binding protein